MGEAKNLRGSRGTSRLSRDATARRDKRAGILAYRPIEQMLTFFQEFYRAQLPGGRLAHIFSPDQTNTMTRCSARAGHVVAMIAALPRSARQREIRDCRDD